MTLHRHDGAAWRQPLQLYRRDGTTWRTVQEAWRHDGTTWRKFFNSSVTSLTAGNVASTIGFTQGSFGSVSPQPDGTGRAYIDGLTVRSLTDSPGSGGFVVELDAGASPGQSYFTSITVNGVTFTTAAAAYTFGSSIARWVWSGTFASLVSGNTYPVGVRK